MKFEAWQIRMVPQGFPAVRKMTGQRKRQLKARLRDSTFDEWQQAMGALERSHFAAARTIAAGEPTSISCFSPSHSRNYWRAHMTTNRLAPQGWVDRGNRHLAMIKRSHEAEWVLRNGQPTIQCRK
jgi:cellulase/cellobiase CelA1